MVGKFTVCKGIGLPSLVLQSKQVETVENFDTEKRIHIPDIIFQNTIHSAIAVPMLHNNELFGVIIGHTKRKTLFSKEEQSLAQIFGNQSATAIKNALYIQSLNISEGKLQKRTAELESIFENSMAGIMLLRGNRIIARCNQRLADIMGYDSAEEMKGLSMREFHLSEKRYQEIGKTFYAPLYTGEQVQIEYQVRKKDGTPLWCKVSAKAIDQSIPPDLNEGVVLVLYDISQRKIMEEEILKNRKLESFAILTGGLGHDFNNIITAILGNIDLSLAVLTPEDQAYSFLQPAKEATLRAKDLTERLQAFSKSSKPILRSASLPEVIQNSATTILKEDITLTFNFEENLPQVQIDKNQIIKAIEGLLTNSVQAMPEGGEIIISCSNITNSGDITGLKNSHYVQTTITDSGHGIAPEVLDQIFDPYFTTKARSNQKGSGLGLATVQSIMKRHKGFITAESNSTNGATVTFYLPISSSDETSMKSPTLRRGKGKILVMDDDEVIRHTIQQMLSLVGYEVETAEEGGRAVSLYRSAMNTADPFNVVIMDLLTPEGMGGVDAVQKVLSLDSNARVIVSSGDPMDPAMLQYEDYGFAASVNKPFEFSELNSTLAKLLTS